jgi:uncharacterized protein
LHLQANQERHDIMRPKVKRFLQMTAAIFIGIIFAIWALIAILKPGPPGRIVLATGGASGLYHEMAKTFVDEMKRNGITLVLRPDLEGTATVGALLSNSSDIHGGFVKGGVSGSLMGRYASDEDRKLHDKEAHALRSVGRLFYEPIWVFYRGPDQVASLREFRGKKIYIGSAKGGSRLVITRLLKANGVDASNSTLITEELPEDAAPLTSGAADVAFVISAPETQKVQKLLRASDILLMNFEGEADAYANRFPAISKLVLRQGGIEFDPSIPSADITLLTTTAALVVRKEMHPALLSLLTQTVLHHPKPGFDPSGDPVLFYKAGEFPSTVDPEYEVAPESRAIYKSAELPFLLRTLAPAAARNGLPFWVVALAHQHGTQLLLLLIPILSVLVPLTRLLPTAYNWSIRRRLLYWYRQLKALEFSIDQSPTLDHIEEKEAELDRIDHAVSRIKVPLNYSDQLYDLRGHIDLVRRRLTPRVALKSAAE